MKGVDNRVNYEQRERGVYGDSLCTICSIFCKPKTILTIKFNN